MRPQKPRQNPRGAGARPFSSRAPFRQGPGAKGPSRSKYPRDDFGGEPPRGDRPAPFGKFRKPPFRQGPWQRREDDRDRAPFVPPNDAPPHFTASGDSRDERERRPYRAPKKPFLRGTWNRQDDARGEGPGGFRPPFRQSPRAGRPDSFSRKKPFPPQDDESPRPPEWDAPEHPPHEGLSFRPNPDWQRRPRSYEQFPRPAWRENRREDFRPRAARDDFRPAPPPPVPVSARSVAMEVLREREQGGEFTETLLDRALSRHDLSAEDRALCQELVYGVVRWQATLDWLAARRTEGRSQKPGLQVLLRLGLYQLLWLDRIPARAAVFETVELAKHLGFGPQAGFVNAALRDTEREIDAIRADLDELRHTQPHIAWSHPEWLVQKWTARWGAENTAKLLEWDNSAAPVFARLNTLRGDATELLANWRKEGVEYDFGRWDWVKENFMFQLKSHPPLARMKSFALGRFYVQDPSTLLAVAELAPQSGETILDCCAAPGGKATLIAARMNNTGTILAEDTDPARLKLIEENCQRLGVTCVKTATAPDGKKPLTEINHFDRVLVDAPCSNTGVLRRRVDARWRVTPGEISRMRATQFELLTRAALRLKPGGTLVYSTCSLEPEENGHVMGEFLAAHPRFTLEAERELLPFKDAVDGAYVARLRRGVA